MKWKWVVNKGWTARNRPRGVNRKIKRLGKDRPKELSAGSETRRGPQREHPLHRAAPAARDERLEHAEHHGTELWFGDCSAHVGAEAEVVDVVPRREGAVVRRPRTDCRAEGGEVLRILRVDVDLLPGAGGTQDREHQPGEKTLERGSCHGRGGNAAAAHRRGRLFRV